MSSLTILTFILAASAAMAAEPYIAVVEKVGGSVGFYTEDGQPAGRVKVGAFPHEAALSADGNLLYVSNNGVLWMTEDTMGVNTISVVDVAARKKLYDIDLGRFHRPHGIAFVPGTDRLLVTTERPFGVVMVDTKTRKVVRDYDVKGKSPHMVMPSKSGEYAYASNTDSGTVAAIELKTGNVKLIQTGERPQGGVFSHSGDRLYVTSAGSNRIDIIDTKSMEVVGNIPTGKGPGRVAITPDGKTLVYNLQQEPAVGFADVATRKQTAMIPLPGNPLSLTMTSDGRRAFAGVQSMDQVFFISVPDRKVERIVETPKDSGPDPAIPLK